LYFSFVLEEKQIWAKREKKLEKDLLLFTSLLNETDTKISSYVSSSPFSRGGGEVV
jgi:hypothetical protein